MSFAGVFVALIVLLDDADGKGNVGSSKLNKSG
jgi:hypothetical protein